MSKRTFAYVSCWDNLGGAPGLGIFDFEKKSGEIRLRSVIREDLSCGFSFIDREKNILYVCVESEDHPDYFRGGGGRIVAFKIDQETGDLTELSSARTFCPNPCYLSLDPTRKFMAVANHSAYNACTKVVLGKDGEYGCKLEFDDAVVEVFGMNEDGSFDRILDIHRHEELAQGRAQHSHPQSAVMAPSGNFFICTDVAEHRIYTYRIDVLTGKLFVCDIYQDEPKSKPRYCLFHSSLPLLYVNYEGLKTLGVFRYAEDGRLMRVADVSGVPDDMEYPEGKGQSGLLMHPSGEYIYDLMTGAASVAVFRLDKSTGLPELIQFMPTKENKLRAIGLSPDGGYMLTTCLQTGNIDVYAVGPEGRLTATDHQGKLKGAAFVSFFEA